MSSAKLVPNEGATFTETMEALAKNFSLERPVIDAILKTKIENLEEFRFLFGDESKIDVFLDKLPLGENRMNQGARLRRCWMAVSLHFKTAEQDRSKVSTTDLDSMLADTELRDVKTEFWHRYKMGFPTEIHPADSVVSRVSREMSKRMLCVFSLPKIRSLQWQLHATQKKRKIADGPGGGIFTEDVEDQDKVVADAETYLDRLMTLMLAYSMAGVTAKTGVDPKNEQGLGADSTLFVEAPLDIMMAYYFRAKRQCSQLPFGQRLQWLEARDLEERSEWVARYRQSTRSLRDPSSRRCSQHVTLIGSLQH